MSTFSTIGAGIVGAVAAVAGIVTVETRPEPTSAIVICEDYIPAAEPGFLTGRGCRQDGRPVRVIVASSDELQAP